MKQLSLLLLFLLLGNNIQPIYGQNNVIKTNLLSLPAGTFSMDYERKLGPKISADLRVNYFFAGAVVENFFEDLTEEIASLTNEETNSFSTAIDQVQGIYITPGFRFYPKKALRGFYLEPNIRFFRYSFNTPYQFKDDLDPDVIHREVAPSNIDFIGGGLNVGGQKIYDNGFSLDFFGGFGYSFGKFHIESQDATTLTNAQMVDIKMEIDDVIALETSENIEDDNSFNLNRSSVTLEEGKISADFAGLTLPIIRIGFSLGYAF